MNHTEEPPVPPQHRTFPFFQSSTQSLPSTQDNWYHSICAFLRLWTKDVQSLSNSDRILQRYLKEGGFYGGDRRQWDMLLIPPLPPLPPVIKGFFRGTRNLEPTERQTCCIWGINCRSGFLPPGSQLCPTIILSIFKTPFIGQHAMVTSPTTTHTVNVKNPT